MIFPEITSILRCPISGEDLVLIGHEGLARINDQLRTGELRHVGGQPASFELEAAVATHDDRFTYPVIDGIFVLLPMLALVSSSSDVCTESLDLPPEMGEVMQFYDEIGWAQAQSGDFADAELFEDLRPVTAAYIHNCHMRVKRHLPPSGKYLLDVASGPLQYDEYLTYSEGYDYRICGDISLTALRAARRKLRDRGIYVQCDITRLPFKDGAVDAAISLHTIYHVPENLQLSAFREIERVLVAGGSGVVVYSWGKHSIAMVLAAPSIRRLANALLPEVIAAKLRRRAGRNLGASDLAELGPELYFRPHSHRWFRDNVAAGSAWEILVWRTVDVAFMKRYIRSERGARFLQRLFRWEDAKPRLFGRIGQYPMLVLHKDI